MTAPAMPESLAAALAELQTKLPQIKKSETAIVKSDKGNYTYSYANLAGISSQLLPLLGAVGLSFSAKPTLTAEGKFVLAYALRHTSGETDEGAYPLPTAGTPQAIGSAITYARRYALCAVTGVAPEADDDDAAAASHQEAQPTVRNRRSAQRQNTAPRSNGGQPVSNGSGHGNGAPPLPGESGYEPKGPTQEQLQRLGAAFKTLGVTDQGKRLAAVSALVGRPVESSRDLANAETAVLLAKLEAFATEGADGPLSLAEAVGRVEGSGPDA